MGRAGPGWYLLYSEALVMHVSLSRMQSLGMQIKYHLVVGTYNIIIFTVKVIPSLALSFTNHKIKMAILALVVDFT